MYSHIQHITSLRAHDGDQYSRKAYHMTADSMTPNTAAQDCNDSE